MCCLRRTVFILLPALILPVAVAEAGDSKPVDDREALLGHLLSAVIRPHLDREFEEEKDWGRTKEVWAGFKTRTEGLKLRISKREKKVPHGTWKRYKLWIEEPERDFELRVADVREVKTGLWRFDLLIRARISGWARAVLYERGLRIGSVSAEGDTLVRLKLKCRLGLLIVPTGWLADVVIDPKIEDAEVTLRDFDLKRISNAKGPLIEELGEELEEIIERKLQKKEIDKRLNRSINKRRDSLNMPLRQALGSGWASLLKRAGG